MKIIVTRPERDAAPLAEKLTRRGHETIILPLMKIVPDMDYEIPRRSYQAICLTSANGVRMLRDISDLRDVPVFAVGQQSRDAADKAGFTNTMAQGGDVAGLTKYLAQNLKRNDGPLLYISGAETSGDLEGHLKRNGFDVDRVVTYAAIPEIMAGKADIIKSADAVVLYSPRSAKLWSLAIEFLQLETHAKRLDHICLSANVAAALPQIWHKSVASEPTENALLAQLDYGSKAD